MAQIFQQSLHPECKSTREDTSHRRRVLRKRAYCRAWHRYFSKVYTQSANRRGRTHHTEGGFYARGLIVAHGTDISAKSTPRVQIDAGGHITPKAGSTQEGLLSRMAQIFQQSLHPECKSTREDTSHRRR